ncbi:sensor histidine kinase [Micropruina sp.]|uniref:sensor histidine kinase n=1 Tax=Micropruina sp. TaxID=2737536 RepID=UPI0039E279B5
MSILRRTRTPALLAGIALLGALAQVVAWMTAYPDLAQLPDAEFEPIAVRMLGEVVLGLLVIALLPLVIGARARPGTRAGVAALAIICAAAASTFAVPVALVSLGAVAAWRRRGWLIAAGAAWVAMLLPIAAADPDGWLSLASGGLVGAVVVLVGLSLGRRSELLVSLRDRAEAVEREQAAVVAGTRLAERTRIAREMHDTLSHRLSLISLHAGGLAVHPDAGPVRVEEAARLIQQVAQTAAEELHASLTVLRDDQHDVRPDVTLADLTVADGQGFAAVPGADVRLSFDPALAGQLETLAPSASRALARVVTEGIANGVKHAPGQIVTLTVTGLPGEWAQVEVRNRLGAGSALAGGYGLIGLRERIELAGGQLDADRQDGDFVLRAWLPWT